MAVYYSAPMSGGDYALEVYVDVLSQDVQNNRSLVRQSVRLLKTAPASTWHAGSSSSLQVYRHGVLLANVSPGYNTQNASSIMLWSEDVWLTHEADGRYAFPLAANFSASNLGSANNVGGTMTLPTIPRASTPRLSQSWTDAGQVLTIHTDRASSTFAHRIRYVFEGGAEVELATNVGDSHTWTIPMSLLNRIPNAVQGTGTIWLDTYTSSSNIGTKQIAFGVRAPASVVPTVSGFTASETTPGLAANVGAFVQNASKPRIVASGAGVYGSTIVSASVKVGAQTMQGSDVTTPNAVTTSGAVPVVITLTDSRSRSETLTSSITVLPWQPPQVASVAVSRRDTAAGTGTQTDSGTYVRIDLTTIVQSLVVSGAERNAASYTLAYRAVGSTGEFTVDRTGTRTVGSSAAFLMASLQVAADASREYLLTVTDDVGSTMVMFQLASSILIHLDGANGIGIRKRRQQGAVDVLGPVFVNDRMLPFAEAAGSITRSGDVANGATVEVVVTFPAGRFTVPPIITAITNADRLFASIWALSATSVTFRVRNGSGAAVTGSFALFWRATQMAASTAGG